MYAIIGPLAFVGAVAVLAPLWYLQKKTEKKGRKVQRKSIGWLLREYDAVGAILITAGMSLTLLPMILASTYEGNWKNGKILAMFCSGIVSFALLAFREIKCSDKSVKPIQPWSNNTWFGRLGNGFFLAVVDAKPIMPGRIWANRTCFGGLVVGFVMTVMASMKYVLTHFLDGGLSHICKFSH